LNFKSLHKALKNQIKNSMRRIAQNYIKLNCSNHNKLDSSMVFQLWTSRYTAVVGSKRFYNLIELDHNLCSELSTIMDTICYRELERSSKGTQEEPSVKAAKAANLPTAATEKQLNYANYLMNMLLDKPLPNKQYSSSEISTIISSLKKSINST
jgi:hypothetical protein